MEMLISADDGAHSTHLSYAAFSHRAWGELEASCPRTLAYPSGKKGEEWDNCSHTINGRRCLFWKQMEIGCFCSTATILETPVHSHPW